MNHNDARDEKWQAHIRAWQESSLSQKQYCPKHDLRISTFGYWRRKLRQSDEPPCFLPLAILPDSPETMDAPKAELTIHHKNGLAIAIGKDFEASTLRRLLLVLDHVA